MKLDTETLQALIKSGELQAALNEYESRKTEKQTKAKIERPRTRRMFKYRGVNFVAVKKDGKSHIYVMNEKNEMELGATVPIGTERKAAVHLANIAIARANLKRVEKGKFVNEDGRPLA